jgi:hypothetical protein
VELGRLEVCLAALGAEGCELAAAAGAEGAGVGAAGPEEAALPLPDPVKPELSMGAR